ncbi:hypothetical protein HYT56_00500 [Candidatus Woesearchaeota archaeon]|nr:hypothetical protein [Candidatus Woesearchaeota archaeon]
MTDYLIFKLERFRHEGGNHINNQVKYWCEINELDLHHPYTDDNPYRLFGKIASLYQKGDHIKTLSEAEISDFFDGGEVELREPLSHDELRILAIQVLEKLGRK